MLCSGTKIEWVALSGSGARCSFLAGWGEDNDEVLAHVNSLIDN